jgi:drug/metabolite transporter (DMT)-like permease
VLSAGLALAASLTWGLGDFLGGLKSRLLPAIVVMAASQPFGLAVLAVMVAVRGTAPPGAEVLWAMLSALLGTIGLAAFYRGLAAGAMSVVAPIAAVAAAFPVIWGLVAGDNVSRLQEAGFVLALGGSLLASLERGAARTRFAAGAGWGVLAMIAFGGYFVPLHEAARHDWLWPSLIFRMTSVALVWSVLLVRRVRLAGVRPHLAALAAVGLLDTGGNVFFAASSSTHGLLSVVSILASLYPVVTVLLARFALGERVQPSQNAGVVVTLAGIVLISAG